ncbi:MAG: PTS sugar transporter subunit IIA [Myxococcota bacterium]
MRLGVREVARLFDVPERTVYRWIREDELPAHEVEGQSRFHRADLLEWATARDITPSPELFEADAISPETSIAAALERGGIHPELTAGDRDEVLTAIVARLPISPADRIVVGEVLSARPDLGKSGLGEGIAIPHVRNPIVLDVALPSITLCMLAQRVDCGPQVSGMPTAVHTVFTLVTPSVRTHLTMLSRLAFTVHEPSVRQALLSKDPATILAAVRELEARPPAHQPAVEVA